ncbi:MAG: radical SAM protein [Clostridia bacterium]|nr:radical SAM protein [Clostridia bacterium]
MNKISLEKCILCPRKCGVNRKNGETGYCGADDKIKIGRSALHFWEEPPISGINGSGAVFFSNCNLGCVFCQNYKISSEHSGKHISEEKLCDIFLDLQKQGAHNINLVTPTHYIIGIANALIAAKNKGLKIPVVYNCGGYENPDALKILDGLVDIYMPDMKYFDDKYAVRYSKAPHYFENCSNAIKEMYRQVGKNEFDENKIMTRGLIVRHMLLPGLLFDSKKILDYLYGKYKDNIYISIMSQYTPMPQIKGKYPEIDKTVSKRYYDALVNYAAQIGIVNAFVQEDGAVGESFIPDFY